MFDLGEEVSLAHSAQWCNGFEFSRAFHASSARAVYLSDGPERVCQIGNAALVFEHTALKESGVELKESGLIVQALKSLGQERINPEVIAKIRAWLPESLRAKVLADTQTATGWIYSAIQQITQRES